MTKPELKPTAQRRPLSGEAVVRLRSRTDPAWTKLALERFDELLIDHAHCEKKAAANALSMLQAYPELPGLPEKMAGLAREEASHLAGVLRHMTERGVALGRDPGDPYVQRLQLLIRKTQRERRLDRLLIAAIIEARSCERLSLLAEALPEGKLRRFYAELAQSEDGHQELFFRLACESTGEAEARARLDELLEDEAKIVVAIGVRPAIH